MTRQRLIVVLLSSTLFVLITAITTYGDYMAKREYVGAPAENGGKPFGDGECVALVRIQTGAAETAKWKKGPLVKGNSKLNAGTAIATFNKDGKYEGHAAMYQFQDETGITVIDQWKGQIPHRRVIRFQDGKADKISNDGGAFYVIQ